MATDQNIAHIRSDLLAGITNANQQRRWRRWSVAAVGPIAALTIGTVAITSPSRAAAFELIEEPNGTISVDILPEFSEIEALQEELEEAGVESSVVALHAPPQLEGLVEVVSHDNTASGAAEHRDGNFVIDIPNLIGEIEILVYSVTPEGERYQAAPSLFRDGEPLARRHCEFNDAPIQTEQVATWLEDIGIEKVEWTVFGETNPDTFEIEFEDFEERPEGYVTGAQLIAADTVWVAVSQTNSDAARNTIAMHDGTHEVASPTCDDPPQ